MMNTLLFEGRAEAVVTSHNFPPIPDRSLDWSAHLDNRVEDTRLYGRGPTEAAAVADLESILDEMAEMRPVACCCGAKPEIDPAVGVGCAMCFRAVYVSDRSLAWAVSEWNEVTGGKF